MRNKTKSNLRIAVSSIALISFVIFSLCRNLVVTANIYSSYEWHLGLANDIFLVVPFIALFVFSIMERKLKYINGRIYVVGIFSLYLIQTIILGFVNETSDFSIFCSRFVCEWSNIVTTIIIVRIIMFVLVTVADKILLKVYSAGMILLFGFALFEIFTTNNIYNYIPVIVIALIIDILFHTALYFFSDLMDKNNRFALWLYYIGLLICITFGDLFDNNADTSDDFDDNIEDKRKSMHFPIEYKKILIYALTENDEDFIPVNDFLGKLSDENVSDSMSTYIPKETYIENLTVLLEKAEEIKEQKPGLISDDFTELLHEILNEQEEYSFRLDMITIAKMLSNHNHSIWLDAVKQYFEYSFNSSKEMP